MDSPTRFCSSTGSNGDIIQHLELVAWIGTILVPMFMAGPAAEQFWQAKSTIDAADSKSDTLTKGFTLLQSLGVTANIITRRAHDLPTTAIEIAIVVYVACAAAAYMIWRDKSKDTINHTVEIPQTSRIKREML
jgi:uncharacterized membrane protein YhaH (DUF805 family)